MTALLLSLGAIDPSSADYSRSNLSDALEQALPSLASAQDYWSASKISLQLAVEHNRLNETPRLQGRDDLIGPQFPSSKRSLR